MQLRRRAGPSGRRPVSASKEQCRCFRTSDQSFPSGARLPLVAGCSKQEAPPAPAPVEVTVLKIEPRDTPIVYEYIAQTQSPQEVNIVARVNGFLDKQLYTEGEIVKEGQVLFVMDQKPFIAQVNEAKAAWDKAKAAHDTALANLNRVKPLAAQNALSKKDLDDATGSEQSSAASLARRQGQSRYRRS